MGLLSQNKPSHTLATFLKHPHFLMLLLLISWQSPQRTATVSRGPGLRDAEMSREAWAENTSQAMYRNRSDGQAEGHMVLLKPLLETSL